MRDKNVWVQGIELDEQAIYECVRKGLSVCQSDIESGLAEYPDGSFDYVILNQSLQEVRKALFLVREALRVGNRVIIGFPNFAHISARISLFFRGKAPMTPSLALPLVRHPQRAVPEHQRFPAFLPGERFHGGEGLFSEWAENDHLLAQPPGARGDLPALRAKEMKPQSRSDCRRKRRITD